MRTRQLTKLTNHEVEQYLERNDLIFVPVGVVETHGGLPLDCETILPEAICSKLAEQADGLYLSGLNYFYAGATQCGRGTVQVSTAIGAEYLGKIAYSLLRQGFRRQVYITFHGPAILTVGPMIRDFYERTKVPILYLDSMSLTKDENGNSLIFTDLNSLNDIFYGAYKILGQLDMVPYDLPESESLQYNPPVPNSVAFMGPINKRIVGSCGVGFYFGHPYEHGGTPHIATREELEARADHGIEIIDKMVKNADIANVVETLRQVDKFTQEELLPRFGEWMYDPNY